MPFNSENIFSLWEKNNKKQKHTLFPESMPKHAPHQIWSYLSSTPWAVKWVRVLQSGSLENTSYGHQLILIHSVQCHNNCTNFVKRWKTNQIVHLDKCPAKMDYIFWSCSCQDFYKTGFEVSTVKNRLLRMTDAGKAAVIQSVSTCLPPLGRWVILPKAQRQFTTVRILWRFLQDRKYMKRFY